MKDQPEDDATPGHDALALVMAGRERFPVTLQGVLNMPDKWRYDMDRLAGQWKEHMGEAEFILNRQTLFFMPDDWKAEMATLLNQYHA